MKMHCYSEKAQITQKRLVGMNLSREWMKWMNFECGWTVPLTPSSLGRPSNMTHNPVVLRRKRNKWTGLHTKTCDKDTHLPYRPFHLSDFKDDPQRNQENAEQPEGPAQSVGPGRVDVGFVEPEGSVPHHWKDEGTLKTQQHKWLIFHMVPMCIEDYSWMCFRKAGPAL